MRLLFTALACVISVSVVGQGVLPDTLIRFNNFSVNYSQEYLQPLEVWYKVNCPKSLNKRDSCSANWKIYIGVSTSDNRHYKNNEWDRGHMAPSASLDCSCEEKRETYTFINCALQNDSLNQRGCWRQLENRERELALEKEVFVYIKVEFINSECINGAKIPSGFFKTLIINGESESYYFKNIRPTSCDLNYYRL